jgi:hypothetical protein
MSLDPRAIALQGIGFGALLVALQGFAPVADQAGGGPVREELRIKAPKQQKPRAIQRAPQPQERPQIRTEPIRPPQAVAAQTFTARAPIAPPLAAVAVALGQPDVPTKAAQPAPQSTREAFPLTATAIAAARIVAEMVAAEAQAAADAELQAAAERRRHNNRAAILVALLASQQ